MKNILLPTDFSENSKAALDFAATLAAKAKANLILVHAMASAQAKPREKKLVMSKMEILEKEMKILHGKKLRCSSQIATGKLETVIQSFEKDLKIDLIVMGTKGAGNLRKAIFGSNTEKMMEKATCPLLAIPENYKIKEIMNIAYATDYSLPEIPIVQSIIKLAGLFNANLMFVHIIGKNEEGSTDRARKYISSIKNTINYGKISYHFVKINDIIGGISSFTEEYKIDILAMATHKRNKIKKFLIESNTKSILYNTAIPLLIYHK